MEPLGERHRFRRQTGRPRRHLATAESGPRPTPRDLRAASPLTEVHRPRARQAVDVVGAPAYDPYRSFVRAPKCKTQVHNIWSVPDGSAAIILLCRAAEIQLRAQRFGLPDDNSAIHHSRRAVTITARSEVSRRRSIPDLRLRRSPAFASILPSALTIPSPFL
jgi:hypothetical protein